MCSVAESHSPVGPKPSRTRNDSAHMSHDKGQALVVHQTARALDRSPPLLQSSSALLITRGDQETTNADAPLATTHSPASLDRGSLACLAGTSTEADVSGRRAGARHATLLHTPNTGRHSLSTAETVSRQDNHLAPPRGRAGLSMLSPAETEGNKRQRLVHRHE